MHLAWRFSQQAGRRQEHHLVNYFSFVNSRGITKDEGAAGLAGWLAWHGTPVILFHTHSYTGVTVDCVHNLVTRAVFTGHTKKSAACRGGGEDDLNGSSCEICASFASTVLALVRCVVPIVHTI